MIDAFLFAKLTNRATAYILYIFLNIIKKIIQFDVCKMYIESIGVDILKV